MCRREVLPGCVVGVFCEVVLGLGLGVYGNGGEGNGGEGGMVFFYFLFFAGEGGTRFATILSMSPKARASFGDMKWSRSSVFSMVLIFWPVCWT